MGWNKTNHFAEVFQCECLYFRVILVYTPLRIQAEKCAASLQGCIALDCRHDYDNGRLLFWNRIIYILEWEAYKLSWSTVGQLHFFFIKQPP